MLVYYFMPRIGCFFKWDYIDDITGTVVGRAHFKAQTVSLAHFFHME
jgi:hypothetical protein